MEYQSKINYFIVIIQLELSTHHFALILIIQSHCNYPIGIKSANVKNVVS